MVYFYHVFFPYSFTVPEDIVDDCIWALAQFILLMEECTEAVLRAVRHVIEGNDYKKTKTVTVRIWNPCLLCIDWTFIQLMNARAKIILHLMYVVSPFSAFKQ
jgi:hypothetical protein